MGTGCGPSSAMCPCAVGKGRAGGTGEVIQQGWHGSLPGARPRVSCLPCALADARLRGPSHTSVTSSGWGPGGRGNAACGCRPPANPPPAWGSTSSWSPPTPTGWTQALSSAPAGEAWPASPSRGHSRCSRTPAGQSQGLGAAEHRVCPVPTVPALHWAATEPHRGRSQGAREGRGSVSRCLGARRPPRGRRGQGQGREGHAEPSLHPTGHQDRATVPGREGV